METSVAMIAHTTYSRDSRVRRQAEALISRGYKVDIIALRENDEKFIYKLNNVTVYQVPISKRRGNYVRYIFEYFSFFLVGSLFLSLLFVKNKYKVIHVHNMPDFLVFSAIIPKLFGAKVILDIHDPFPEVFATKFKSNQKGLRTRLLNFEEKISIKYADHVITVTEMVRSLLLQKGVENSKISTILNTPDRRIFNRPAFPDSDTSPQNGYFKLLFAGTILERNGLANVVKALPLLIKKIPHIRFRVVGDGDYVEDFKKLVAKFRLQNHVELEASRPIEQIPDEIMKADAIVWFPDRNDFIDIALSVKVLEALVMGKPVIGTKTKCHEYYFNENELLFVESTDSKEIARGILYLYENYEKIKPTPDNIQKFIAKFDWENDKQKYFAIIDQLMNGVQKRQERKF